MQPSRLAKRVWFLIFLAVIAFYFYGLGHIPFVGPDEPRYAQVAREMFQSGDLITPTLGGHTWFEKPPLLYWTIIAGYSVFGVSEWAARLGPALCGLLTIAAVFWIGSRVRRNDNLSEFGQWSAFVTASTLGIIVFSRGVGFDSVVTMTIAWALAFFLVSETTTTEAGGSWQDPDGRRRRLWIGFYAFIGLSLLAKGLVGLVIPIGVLGAYYLIRRERPSRSFISSLIWGLPLALVVAGIWYVPVTVRHGWAFVDEFILQHHFARYVSNKYHHPQPFFFYFLIIIPLTLPWTVFFAEGLAQVRKWRWRGADAEDKLRTFSAAWLLFPMVFFSFSGSKLPGYILPLLPAAALIAGERLTSFVRHGSTRNWPMRITGAMCGLFAIGGVIWGIYFARLPRSCVLLTAAPVIVAAIICVLLTPTLGPPATAGGSDTSRTTAAMSIGLATFTSIVIALNCGASIFATRESTRELIRVAAARGYDSSPVYALHEIDRTAEFYAAGRIVYGADGDPIRFESALDVLDAARKTNGPILVFVPEKYIYQLTSLKGVRTELIGSNGVLALVGVSPR
ncbi:MAG TPA: glycosyltransferase family 39 protein [Pyrinomonadaceae bacterium]|nr:glycosyltransferase family 39 protein [Pyrinomonadaceae bacterium]